MSSSSKSSDSQSQNSRQRPRYQKIRELGHNRAGGIVTYLATDTQTGEPVVIKQFQFAQSGSEWSGFKTFEREIQVLRSLNHTGIPRYLDSFETPKGFCMVQEYKNASSLAVPRSFSSEEIKQIAISVLDILIYLQNQTPPIVHRDIKPDNILVDDRLNVYLVDFGLARIGYSEGATSSVAAGTFGFMAPEQLYNRQLSNATDLYGFGATLICVLAGTKSSEIEKLIDEDNRLSFNHLASQLSPSFMEWLSKMVQPGQKDRYPSAAAAKTALIQPIQANSTARVPEVQPLQLSKVQPAPVTGNNSTHWVVDFFKSLISPESPNSWQQIYNPSEEEVTLALTRRGTPTWTEEDFQQLLVTLGCAGYGWLIPVGVRQQLEAMRQKRQLAQSRPRTKRGEKQ
jgi:serine/threonine protein kinase